MVEAQLDVGEPVVVGDRVIRPLARRTVHTRDGERSEAIVGHIEPVGVLVETPAGVQALDLDGEEMAFEISFGDGDRAGG